MNSGTRLVFLQNPPFAGPQLAVPRGWHVAVARASGKEGKTGVEISCFQRRNTWYLEKPRPLAGDRAVAGGKCGGKGAIGEDSQLQGGPIFK